MIDDELDQCMMLKDLRSTKLSLVTATSVAETVQKHDLKTFAAAIIDWHLPGESGIVLSRLLRTVMPEQRIFLYSADDAAAKYESGSFRFVPKSVEPEELERQVYAAIVARGLKKTGRFV